MTTLHSIQLATQIFLKKAYFEQVPKKVSEAVDSLQKLETDDALLAWPGFEKGKKQFRLRLGNHRYPHMKLVFIMDGGQPVFYVDAHDAHFDVSPDTIGFEKLLELRAYNKKLKQAIEAAWAAKKLPIFGSNRAPFKNTNACKGLKILAIDDEAQILDMLGMIFKSLGARYVLAKSVEEAREAIKTGETPDVVFCDIMMPTESGYDFVNWLKKEKLDIPVFFITGYAMDQIKKRWV